MESWLGQYCINVSDVDATQNQGLAASTSVARMGQRLRSARSSWCTLQSANMAKATPTMPKPRSHRLSSRRDRGKNERLVTCYTNRLRILPRAVPASGVTSLPDSLLLKFSLLRDDIHPASI